MQQSFRFWTAGDAEKFFVYSLDRRIFVRFADGHILVAIKNGLYSGIAQSLTNQLGLVRRRGGLPASAKGG